MLLPSCSIPPRSHTIQIKAWIQHEELCRGIYGEQGAVVEYTLQGERRLAEMAGLRRLTRGRTGSPDDASVPLGKARRYRFRTTGPTTIARMLARMLSMHGDILSFIPSLTASQGGGQFLLAS